MTSNTYMLGPSVPRRGNALTRAAGRGALRLLGWRLEGQWPDVPRLVVVVAPHTSNWDFFLALCTMFALGLRGNWIGKHTLFRPPFGGLMRYLGGAPVDRTSTVGRVAQVVAQIRSSDGFVLGVAPEGTRTKTERWRSGFYHIAAGAGVPILLAWIDYRRRVVGFGPTVEPSGDETADIAAMRGFYDPSWAKYPEQA